MLTLKARSLGSYLSLCLEPWGDSMTARNPAFAIAV